MVKIRKILFLNPPDPSLIENNTSAGYAYYEPPLGLLYVYSFMKNRDDLEVKFVDLNIEMKFISKMNIVDTLKTHINDFRPDLIAISTLYYSSIHVFHLLAKHIKNINSNILVVFGGHYPTHLTDKCLSDSNIDYAILSEGELGFSDLIDALNGQKILKDVEGVAFKNGEDIIKNPRLTFWEGFANVKRLPWEDTHFHYYFREGRNVLYRIKKKEEIRLATVTATRGCPNTCTFCSSSSFWKRRWRKRNISNVIDEIRYLKDSYHINTVVFNDENISINKSWLIEFLKELKKLNITWISGGGLSIRTINDDNVIQTMYESGIGLFNLAIESGSNNTLKRVKKPLTIEETDNTIKLIRKHGNAVAIGFFIVGFPFEDLASVKQTIDYADSLDLDWKCFYCFQPFPGSDLYTYSKERRLIEDFDIHYGENYFSPDMKHIDYTSVELNRLNYKANIKSNFVDNRNLKIGTNHSLQQAERDFRYVLDMAPNHVFALLGLSEVMRLQKRNDQRIEYLKLAKDAMKENNGTDWAYYLKQFEYDIDVMLSGSYAQ